jgi:hypothetical protein
VSPQLHGSLAVTVSRFSLAGSHRLSLVTQWNKIEHRMVCHITENWRGRPLLSHQVVVNLIASTQTSRGLKIRAALDTKSYPTGIDVSDDDLASVKLTRDPFHGEWNYIVRPTAQSETVN